jgi:hypothetical protein
MGNVKALRQNTRRRSLSSSLLSAKRPNFVCFHFLDDRIFIHLEDVKRSQNLCIVFLRASLSFYYLLAFCVARSRRRAPQTRSKIDTARKYFATPEHLSWEDENFDRFILAAKVKAAT